MRVKDIKVGESYRHRSQPKYCWAKVIAILQPKENENQNAYVVVKCKFTVEIDDCVGAIKYFRPSELVSGRIP